MAYCSQFISLKFCCVIAPHYSGQNFWMPITYSNFASFNLPPPPPPPPIYIANMISDTVYKLNKNTVEAQFKKKMNFDICVILVMSRWIYKQPGIQQFWNLCCHYQDIYDWISPLNKLQFLRFILTLQSMREKSMVNPITCIVYLLFFGALNEAFQVHLFFIFTPYYRHW